MPNAATVTSPSPSPQAAQVGGEGAQPAMPANPFVRASMQHVEPANIDRSNVIGASTILLGPDDVPAYGYLRSLLIRVDATGGTGTAAVAREDAPWNALDEITLSDVNGAPIVGPISGYDLYLIHKWGGTVAMSDPTRSPVYSAVANTGNFAFVLRVPVEISDRDALGSLANANASATYKLRIVQAANTTIYSANPTGAPTMRVRVWAECWSQPQPMDSLGRPNSPTPPALGTTQFWSRQVINVTAGQQTIQLKRVGNLIRNHVLIFRTDDATPVRSTTELPSPLSLYFDSQLVWNADRDAVLRQYMAERQPSATIDTGVIVIDHTHDFDGLLGGEMRDQWLPTTQATRLELQGSFGGSGTLTVLTNDVAPRGDYFIG